MRGWSAHLLCGCCCFNAEESTEKQGQIRRCDVRPACPVALCGHRNLVHCGNMRELQQELQNQGASRYTMDSCCAIE